ncbi:hypothetical protein [Nocardiopsis rhodophaea]|uniref:hypothetical protein n=1 Tax=Nocardiopsis rhodophaea TaxID=280238 RepID=UPI0031D32DE9
MAAVRTVAAVSGETIPDELRGSALPVRAGSAAAVAETSNEIGKALGIALLGSLAAVISRRMGPDAAPTLNMTVELPGLGAAVITEAKSALVTGPHATVVVVGLLHGALGVLALRWLPKTDIQISDRAAADGEPLPQKPTGEFAASGDLVGHGPPQPEYTTSFHENDHRHSATAALHGMVSDRTIAPDHRGDAAEALASLGGVDEQQVRDYCETLLRHALTSPEDAVLALGVLHSLSPDSGAVTATAVWGVISSAHMAGAARVLGGKVLRKLGSSHVTRNVRLLTETCDDPTLAPRERIAVVELLLEVGPCPRALAIDTLRRILHEPTLSYPGLNNLLRQTVGREGIWLEEIFETVLETRRRRRDGIVGQLQLMSTIAEYRSDLRDRYLAYARDLLRNHEQPYWKRCFGAFVLGRTQHPDAATLRSMIRAADTAQWPPPLLLKAIEHLYAMGGEHRRKAVRHSEAVAHDVQADIGTSPRVVDISDN